jgi:hypothetical protein
MAGRSLLRPLSATAFACWERWRDPFSALLGAAAFHATRECRSSSNPVACDGAVRALASSPNRKRGLGLTILL